MSVPGESTASRPGRRARGIKISVLGVLLFTIGCASGSGSASAGPSSQCEAACDASCQRGKECNPSNTADCGTECRGICNGSRDDPNVDVDACVAQIKSLSCDQGRQVAKHDLSPLMGKCG
jgi:hypothetical protein